MDFEPISTARMIALMVAGAIFAGVGLYMMLRPKAEGAAKVEIFGLKFESSSAGLLVFAVGAGFMSLPLFVPERLPASYAIAPPEVIPLPTLSPPETIATPTLTPAELVPDASVGQEGKPRPADALMAEVEPNEGVREANSFEIGQTVAGKAGFLDQDWYTLKVPVTGLVGHEIRLRSVSGAPSRVDIFNAREENVGFVRVGDGAQYLTITSTFADHLFFRVKAGSAGGTAGYELTVLPPGQN